MQLCNYKIGSKIFLNSKGENEKLYYLLKVAQRFFVQTTATVGFRFALTAARCRLCYFNRIKANGGVVY